MEKLRNLSLWTEEGYHLFAREGLEGLQIERLARILQLNKSGFYHYFGDLEGYCMELTKLHHQKVKIFLEDARQLKTLDPDYLLLLIEHTTTVMFQVQLTRTKDRYSFYNTSELVDLKVNAAVQQLWNDFLGHRHNADLAIRYYYIVRDMFYTRVSFQNFTYAFLHDLVTDAKVLIDQITERRLQSTDKFSL
ncbi:transcriptional regulator, TetR family [Chryseolinea serpens]|uniref:Transcriptional regulator, TetR family n=1 Tax=Chryseolinea serpens TaxID=947013 RepID=A0A1M5QXQ2_9BACT|nr:TetR/AcrR family transcriptional regulator [Chryseolinea serpens]SHH18967.1 transcriptional regulator, TetR family [Chryseolinea serpens]